MPRSHLTTQSRSEQRARQCQSAAPITAQCVRRDPEQKSSNFVATRIWDRIQSRQDNGTKKSKGTQSKQDGNKRGSGSKSQLYIDTSIVSSRAKLDDALSATVIRSSDQLVDTTKHRSLSTCRRALPVFWFLLLMGKSPVSLASLCNLSASMPADDAVGNTSVSQVKIVAVSVRQTFSVPECPLDNRLQTRSFHEGHKQSKMMVCCR